MRRSASEIALSIGVLALGAGTAVGTALLPAEGGYARIGPNFFPGVTAVGLIALGAWLLYEALRGGWKGGVPDDPQARGEHAYHALGFAWISAGLFAQMLLIDLSGFVVAGTALFACVARGFGSRRIARDIAMGLVLALGVFLFFTRFLNVGLPAGWLAPLLGGAGI